ncbi:MAG: alpha/beta fold hydrolase BchO [Pseudomonadota bacterium]
MRAPILPADWPYRAASRHIACKPHLWHVQDVGTGPLVLLLHGAGGATHSFRHLMPLLAPHYRIVALDLPGQGFTVLGARGRCGLDPVAEDIAALIRQQGWQPFAIIGHSAGGAIAQRLAELLPLKAVVGINSALGPFEGVEGWLFPVMAKALALTPFVPRLFSKLAGTPAQVRQLIATTGSTLDAQGQALYLHLMQKPAHVSATLAMMSQWTLTPFLRRLKDQKVPSLLLTATNDRAVPPAVSARAAQVMPNATWHDITGYGHLVHEEAAELVAAPILAFLSSVHPTGAA